MASIFIDGADAGLVWVANFPLLPSLLMSLMLVSCEKYEAVKANTAAPSNSAATTTLLFDALSPHHRRESWFGDIGVYLCLSAHGSNGDRLFFSDGDIVYVYTRALLLE